MYENKMKHFTGIVTLIPKLSDEETLEQVCERELKAYGMTEEEMGDELNYCGSFESSLVNGDFFQRNVHTTHIYTTLNGNLYRIMTTNPIDEYKPMYLATRVDDKFISYDVKYNAEDMNLNDAVENSLLLLLNHENEN